MLEDIALVAGTVLLCWAAGYTGGRVAARQVVRAVTDATEQVSSLVRRPDPPEPLRWGEGDDRG